MALPLSMKMRTDVAMAFLFDLYRTLRFATRLPLPLLSREHEEPFVSADGFAPAFVVSGAVVGLVGGAVLVLAAMVGASPEMAAVLSVASMVMLTGGLHEDGLADCADGIGGGRTRERKLEIMRDSAIGTYGVLALILSVVGRVTALAAIVAVSPLAALMALVATQTFSRSAAMALAARLAPARPDGAGARLGTPSARAAYVAGVSGGAIALTALVLGLGVVDGLVGWLLAVAAMTGLAWLVLAGAERHIGGQTGDVLGAAQQLTDLAGLAVLSISIPILF